MSRLKKILRNIIILAVIFFLYTRLFGLFLDPLTAHEHSERSIHYGPSEVVHVEDFDGGKYILGKYDNWVSCNTVHRVLFFLWRFGNQPIGFENDTAKAISYTWGTSSMVNSNQNHRVYGIINDDSIKKVEITLADGEILTQTDFYEDLFLITWKSSNSNDRWPIKIIRAYNSGNKIIFEEEHP